MTLDELNRLDPSAAASAFMRCCGATAWAAAMTAARPFRSLDAMRRRADEIWASLGRRDWLEAFAAHPEDRRTAGRGGVVNGRAVRGWRRPVMK